MASPAPSSVYETPMALLPVEHSEAIVIETQPKLKGRQRLIQGLQRISSSPSLQQIGRRRATSNPLSARSNYSSASLASPANSSFNPNYGASMSSQSSSGGYSTAPTSVPSTPGGDSSFSDSLRSRLVMKKLERGFLPPGILSSKSTPLQCDVRPGSRAGTNTPLGSHSEIPEIVEDYFSRPIPKSKPLKKFDFWTRMPHEIKLSIFTHLKPKELVRVSIVNKLFYQISFDGQLWTCFDASEFYSEIPADSLAKIIVAAGPFVKDLNLRGCVQMEHYKRAEVIVKACKNLINATLEGCRNFQRSTLHHLLTNNERLAHLNLTGLTAVNNGTCKIISKSCPQLEVLNVSWCTHMDTRGLRMVILGCPRLRDLRAGEVRGFNDMEIANDIFKTNNLESLVLSGCSDLDDAALQTMIHGVDPEMDILEDRPLVPARRLRHLDLSRCARLTNAGINALAWNVPELEGLALAGCSAIEDSSLGKVLATTPRLTHLDLEELSELTNTFLSEHVTKAPCASRLQHLSISYCESLGDTGVLPVLRACTSLQKLDMDNTRISDLVLAEAVTMVQSRSTPFTLVKPRSNIHTSSSPFTPPSVSLHMVIYDCPNVTWTGIREILSRNSEIKKTAGPTGITSRTTASEVISLKCFYGWQLTVDEHMKRVLRGDLAAAGRLDRKWMEYMILNEEAGAGGAGSRRRRRRAREAALMHADEEGTDAPRRRRARSGGCAIM